MARLQERTGTYRVTIRCFGDRSPGAPAPWCLRDLLMMFQAAVAM